MHPVAICSELRPLQVEQARAAAKLVPGAAFDAAADPAGTLVSDLTDSSFTGVPAEVQIASVEIAETPDLGITEIIQTVVGALPKTAHNRYTTIVDLDADATTGCNAADLDLPTAFRGAELVVSVDVEAADDQPTQLRPSVWRCQSGTLIPLSDSNIAAQVSDTGLADVGAGPLLGRIKVRIPSNLIGPRAEVVRVQAFAEQLRAGGKMSRVPVSPDDGGLVSLFAPVLPTCSLSAPVVNPGSTTCVRAEELPPGTTVDVFLGGDLVATGVVDDAGVADVELPIPSTSRLGLRPVMVQVKNTLFVAQCEVEVTGNPVTPVTSAVVTPAPNEAGWNKSNVMVTLAAVSPRASVTSLTIRASGAAQTLPANTVMGASAVISISAEGETTLTYFATDSSGRVEPEARLVVRIDRTSPEITCSVSPERLWPPNHKLVTVTASVAVTDRLSGGAGFVLASVASDEADSGLGHGDIPNDIQDFDIGTPDISGRLRVERSGRGKGRVYTLTYRGMDVAGNAATCVTKVIVLHGRGSEEQSAGSPLSPGRPSWCGPVCRIYQRHRIAPSSSLIMSQIFSLILIALLHSNYLSNHYWILLPMTLPAVLPGTAIGVMLYRQISDVNFKRVSYLLLGLSGVALLLKIYSPVLARPF